MRIIRTRPAALKPRTKSFVLEGHVAALIEKMAAALNTTESALVNAILDRGSESAAVSMGCREPAKDADFPVVGTKKETIKKFRPSGQALSRGTCAFCGDALRANQWVVLAEIPRLIPAGRLSSLLRHAHMACASTARYRPGGMASWSTVDNAPLLIWRSGVLDDLRKEFAPRTEAGKR